MRSKSSSMLRYSTADGDTDVLVNGVRQSKAGTVEDVPAVSSAPPLPTSML